MSFASDHIKGQPDLARRLFESAGLTFQARIRGNESIALCPFHDDHTPSLSVNLVEALFLCRACGERGDVVTFFAKKKGITPVEAIAELRSLGVGEIRSDDAKRQPVAIYNYTDESGQALLRKLRFPPKSNGKKSMVWQHVEAGAWRDCGGCRHEKPLYRLPELKQAGAEAIVYVVEGEKAADRLASAGLVATTSGGATSWSAHHAAQLPPGRDIAILRDNDAEGLSYATKVAASMHARARSVRMVLLPGLPPSGDPFDFLENGGSARDIETIVATTPAWVPQAAPIAQTEGSSRSWPGLPDEALHGLAGDVVRTLDPHTEAAPAAILGHFLVFFGNCVGVSPHVRVGADDHRANEFVVLVGRTAKGRKGTAEGQVRRLFEGIDDSWADRCLVHGLSSGEGLIHALEVTSRPSNGQPADPRICAIEAEFSNVIDRMQRDGNTLSGVLRQAWDRGNLRVMTRQKPLEVRGTHTSVIAHVTSSELLSKMDSSQASNGFANRFLWFGVHRSKELPNPTPIPDEVLADLRSRIGVALDAARRISEVGRTPEANELWKSVYGRLSAERAGLVGALTSRAEAHVIRLALIYALLDSSHVVDESHLRAALAVWKFSESCAQQIFGGRLGNPIAWRIVQELRAGAPDHVMRSDITREIFSGNLDASRLEGALQLLEELGLARRERLPAEKGRPAEVWYAVGT